MDEMKEIEIFLENKIKYCENYIKNTNSAFYHTEMYNLQMYKKIQRILNNKKPSKS